MTKSISAHNNASIKINAYLTELASRNQFSGSILIAQNGEILLNQGYGFAQREFNVANTPQTKFTIASLTKPITTIALLQLYEKGLLHFTDTLDKYVPEFIEGKKVTIHHLLSHTSGVPDFTSVEDIFTKIKFPISVKDRALLFARGKLEFEPGTHHSYSQPNYYLLVYIIELLSGISYEEYVIQHIFKPAGMLNTGSHLHREIVAHLASGYVYEDGTIRMPDYFDMSWAHGTGGFYSTVEDLYLLDRALYTEKLLKKSSLQLMYRPHSIMIGHDSSYGYGWEISRMHNKKYVAQPGKMFGFSSYFIRFVDDDITIILLSNLEESLEQTKNKIINIVDLLIPSAL
jgi:CubicO group peptidase (beta-lactamase class C family)